MSSRLAGSDGRPAGSPMRTLEYSDPSTLEESFVAGSPDLSVVMPAFNEQATIREAVGKVLDLPFVAELLVIDDGSADQTVERLLEVSDPRLRVIRHPVNRGKGAAVRTGMAAASAPFLAIQDADLEYSPADLERLLIPLRDGRADVVYGSRFISGNERRVLYFWHSMGNKLLTNLSNMFTNLNLSDMETGYKLFTREVARGVTLVEDRFGFEPEFTAKIARARYRVYEVGISYSGRTYAEGKKITWRDGVRALYCIIKYSRG